MSVPRAYERPAYPNIKVPEHIDPVTCHAWGFSQERFARMLGVSVRTVPAWERLHWRKIGPDETPDTGTWKVRRRNVSSAGRVLLAMLAVDPWIVYDVLSGQLQRKLDSRKTNIFD